MPPAWLLRRERGIAVRVGRPSLVRDRARPSMPSWRGAIDALRPDVLALAGFMRILGAGVRRALRRAPRQRPPVAAAGLHRAAHAPARDRGRLQAGRRDGALRHADLDHGPIIAQAVVPVLPDDTEDDAGGARAGARTRDLSARGPLAGRGRAARRRDGVVTQRRGESQLLLWRRCRRAQNRLAAMLIVNARIIVLKTNDSTACSSTRRRIGARRDGDVRGLRGDRDREREVEEVAVVRLEARLRTGKSSPAVAVRAWYEAGVVEREQHRQQQPGADHGAERERDVRPGMARAWRLRRRQLDDDRSEADERRQRDHREHGRRAFGLCHRDAASVVRGRRAPSSDHAPAEVEPDADVPADQAARHRVGTPAEQQRDAGGQRASDKARMHRRWRAR